MIKISSFLIGIVVVGFILFGVFGLVQSVNNYSNIGGYSDSKMKNNINFSKNVTADVNKAQTDINALTSTPSIFDVLGFFTNSVKGAIKGLFSSFVIFNEFVDASTQDAGGFGAGFVELKNLILLVLTISLFISFIAYLLLGRDI